MRNLTPRSPLAAVVDRGLVSVLCVVAALIWAMVAGSTGARAGEADDLIDRMISSAKMMSAGASSDSESRSQPSSRKMRLGAKIDVDIDTDSDKAGKPSRADGDTPRRKANRGTQVASLGPTYIPTPKPSLSEGGNINWVASASCLDSSLKSVIHHVAQNYGSVTVNSTCRSHAHNRSVGGAPKSYHLTGNAADFRVHGNWGSAYSYLKGTVGGLSHYGGGLFHIDTGPRRPM